jgi:hypothetical protein
MTRHCSNLASAVHKTLCRRRLHCQSQFLDGRLLATLSRRIPHDIQSLLILASFPRFDSDTSCTQFYLAGLPPLVRHCHFTAPTAKLHTLCRRSTPCSCNATPFEVLSAKFFSLACLLACCCEFSVTSNFTIDDGLELELDKMMTSFGAAALPQHRLRSIPFDCFFASGCLVAIRFSASSRRHVTNYSNLASAVHKTLCRRRFHSGS